MFKGTRNRLLALEFIVDGGAAAYGQVSQAISQLHGHIYSVRHNETPPGTAFRWSDRHTHASSGWTDSGILRVLDCNTLTVCEKPVTHGLVYRTATLQFLLVHVKHQISPSQKHLQSNASSKLEQQLTIHSSKYDLCVLTLFSN